MTTPALSIEIGFGATASLGSFFVLDDVDPDGVAGHSRLYDPANPTFDYYTLAGTVFVDVTEYVSGQVTTTRGRSQETDQYGAGTMSFTLRNEDRRFDPSNTAGPYYPGPSPRLLVNAYLTKGGTTQQVFGGYIDDLTVNYDLDGASTVEVTCVDAFNVLANMKLRSFAVSPGAPTTYWTTGKGITKALTAGGFTSAHTIDAGLTEVQASTQDNVTVLDFSQTMARSENGFFFCDSAGVVTFKNRHFSGLGASQATFSDDPADWPSAIGYSTLAQRSATTLLYNEVSGQRNGASTTQVEVDADSQAKYLPRALSLSQLENKTNADVANLCRYLLGRYSTPDVRFDAMSVELLGLDDDQAATVLALDLTDTITITRTPPGSGSPSQITLTCLIDGIGWSMDASSGSFRVTYNLSLLRSRQTFILDDAALGVLDTSRLDY